METLLDEITLDKKRRLAMGRILKNKKISSFEIYETEHGYVLKPKVSVPAEELWIFENKQAKKSLVKGLSQEAKHDLGSFARYVEED